jgi:hypothetical protein
MNPARPEKSERMRNQDQGARSEDFDIRNLSRNDGPDLRSVQSTDVCRALLSSLQGWKGTA